MFTLKRFEAEYATDIIILVKNNSITMVNGWLYLSIISASLTFHLELSPDKKEI